jgi:hypothetical protein
MASEVKFRESLMSRSRVSVLHSAGSINFNSSRSVVHKDVFLPLSCCEILPFSLFQVQGLHFSFFLPHDCTFLPLFRYRLYTSVPFCHKTLPPPPPPPFQIPDSKFLPLSAARIYFLPLFRYKALHFSPFKTTRLYGSPPISPHHTLPSPTFIIYLSSPV